MASKSTHVRSNSFPSRTHPTALRVEEILNKIKPCELSSGTSESICYGLCRLAELYQCVDDLLNLPSTIQALSEHSNNQKCLGDELLDGSVRILDVCGIAREIASQFKENVGDLQSSLRRRKGDSSMESSLNNYACFRKKMKKDAKRSMATLKQIDQVIGTLDHQDDQRISSVIREVNSTSIDVLQSVLIFLSSKAKTSKWSLVSRLVNKAGGSLGSCEDQEESQNEFEIVDSALQGLCRNDENESTERIQFAQTSLETLEASIDGVESGLDGVFRCLIRSRTSLLNIFSC